MLDAVDASNVDAKGIPFTVRTVFVIDPKKVIRLTLSYPAQTGRNFDEILRVVDSLQLGDKYKVGTPVSPRFTSYAQPLTLSFSSPQVVTPVNWNKGDDVIVHASLNDQQAKELFPNHTAPLVSPTHTHFRA
jgi:alkyl hydroperoxide reductase subunit AhpC